MTGPLPLLTLLAAVTTNQTSIVARLWGTHRTVQASIAGSGAVSATVTVEVSNDQVGWITAATITLSGTDSDTDGVAIDAAWGYTRVTLSGITGTSAAVTATLCHSPR